MTKKVRIEDADNSSWRVKVQTWTRSHNGGPDVMESETVLTGPTDLRDFWIHSHKYVVVSEFSSTPTPVVVTTGPQHLP